MTRSALESAIRAIEHGPLAGRVAIHAASTGIVEIDEALPWGGLPRAMVHDVIAPSSSGAGIGFAAVMSAAIAGDTEHVVWCGRADNLYGPGLAAFGLDLRRLLMIETPNKDDIPWVLEEAVRSKAPAVVVGMMPRRTISAKGSAYDVMLRRLQLACERGGVTVLLVHHRDTMALKAPIDTRGPTATRWCVRPAPSFNDSTTPLSPSSRSILSAPPSPVWQLDLIRCRGGRPGRWIVAWQRDSSFVHPFHSQGSHDSSLNLGINCRAAAHRLTLVSQAGNRPAVPAPQVRDVNSTLAAFRQAG